MKNQNFTSAADNAVICPAVNDDYVYFQNHQKNINLTQDDTPKASYLDTSPVFQVVNCQTVYMISFNPDTVLTIESGGSIICGALDTQNAKNNSVIIIIEDGGKLICNNLIFLEHDLLFNKDIYGPASIAIGDEREIIITTDSNSDDDILLGINELIEINDY